jgi:IS30 family transposase
MRFAHISFDVDDVDKISIDKRSKIVDKKARIGDWEIDTVIGKEG